MQKTAVEQDGVEDIDGDALLEEVETEFRRYVVLPSEDHYVALVLWTAATHGIAVWDHAPRAVFTSPEKRCGKTRAQDVSGEMCFAPLEAVQTSIAALYRTITVGPRTILHDEADGVFSSRASDAAKEELRVFYNGGFHRNKPVLRCVDGGQRVRAFATFAMVSFTSIGDLPDTIMDRAVVFRMRRRAVGEKVEPLRERDKPALQQIGVRLTAWVASRLDDLREADPPTPLEDRQADVWAPLLAIADAAGGDWPDRARAAAVALTGSEAGMSRETSGQMLLADIRRVWSLTADRVGGGELPNRAATAKLVQVLNSDAESGWKNFGKGSGLDPTSLAELLRPYEIRPKLMQTVAKGEKRARGYLLTAFQAAWERYLPADVTADPPLRE